MGIEGMRREWAGGSCFRPATNVVYTDADRGGLPPSTRRLVEEQGAYFELELNSLQERADEDRNEKAGSGEVREN